MSSIRLLYVLHVRDKKAIQSLKDWVSLYRYVLRYRCRVERIILVPRFFVIFRSLSVGEMSISDKVDIFYHRRWFRASEKNVDSKIVYEYSCCTHL